MSGTKKSAASKKKAINKKKEELKRKQAEKEQEENETEFQKACLEIRVKELETLNAGILSKCDYLDSQNNVFKTQLEETREERDDLVNYLQRCLTEEQTITKELEDRLFGMLEARKDDLKDFDQKFAQKDEEFDTMKTKLDKIVLEQGLKLASIEEFRLQKVELSKQMEELKRTLEDERTEFSRKFDELENKTIVYREKLKKDAIEMVIKISEDVQKAGKMSLTSSIKAAITANVKLNQELETVSQDNLKLRDTLDQMTSKNRERKVTIEILEEENSLVHRKCLQYKNTLEILLDKQVEMENRIKIVERTERELSKLREEHDKCKTEDEISNMIRNSMTATVVSQEGTLDAVGTQREIRHLREVIIKMAVVAKDLSEAANVAEVQFLKGRFKNMLIKLYESACEIQNLPDELRSRLVVQLPSVSALKPFS